jgi:hypothetical protein
MPKFVETPLLEESNSSTTSWFINTNLVFDDQDLNPKEGIAIFSDKTEGAWEDVLTRIANASANALNLIQVEVLSININDKLFTKEVVDAELDTLLNITKATTPLFKPQQKNKKAKEPVMFFINCIVTCPTHVDIPLKGNIKVRMDAPREQLSVLLAKSKVKLNCSTLVTGIHNPRIKQVATLVGNLDEIV